MVPTVGTCCFQPEPLSQKDNAKQGPHLICNVLAVIAAREEVCFERQWCAKIARCEKCAGRHVSKREHVGV